ncbi:unnamed protein product, partial [Ixodes hexagonus]
MDEILEHFDSASDDQPLEKEPLSRPEQPPNSEHVEAREEGSDSGNIRAEGTTEIPSSQTCPPNIPADEVPRSTSTSNGGIHPTPGADGERTLKDRLDVCAIKDDVVRIEAAACGVETSDTASGVVVSDIPRPLGDVGVASRESAPSDVDTASGDVASSSDQRKQPPAVASDASRLVWDPASSDDECDDPPVAASDASRRGCRVAVASSDDSLDASLDASRPGPGDGAASSGDELPLSSSAGAGVDDSEKEDAVGRPKSHKAEKVQRKSAQRAMELQQIYSTSQRMMRENKMALPYHEPAKLSLRAFLDQRRSKPSPETPQQAAEGPVEERALPPESQPSIPLAETDTAGTSALSERPDEDSQDSKEPVKLDHAPTGRDDRNGDEALTGSSATGASVPSSLGSSRLLTPALGRRRLDILAAAGNLTPCLSRDAVIVLGDDSGRSGVSLLLERLVKHAKVDQGKAKDHAERASVTVNHGQHGQMLWTCRNKWRPPVLYSKQLALQNYMLTKLECDKRSTDNVEGPRAMISQLKVTPPSPFPAAAILFESYETFLPTLFSPLCLSQFSADDNDGDDTSDEEEVVATHRKSRRVNPVLEDDDEDEEEAPRPKDESRRRKDNDAGDDSDDGLLKLPPFGDADDEDEPSASAALETQGQLEDDLMDPLRAGGAASTALALSPERVSKSFQSDDLLVFSPLTGLSSIQRKSTTSEDGLTPASDCSPATPPRSAIKEAPSLPLSPLTGVDSASVTPLRKNLSGKRHFERPWDRSASVTVDPSQDMDELVELCSGSFGTRKEADDAGDTGSQFENRTPIASGRDADDEDVDDVEDNGEDDDAGDEAEDEPEHDEHDRDEDEDGEAEEMDDAGGQAKKRQVLLSFAVWMRSLRDFFEDEAELSGSDVGSDGEDDEEDEEGVLADLIAAEDGKEDSGKLREEIGRFHFKQLLDEDKRELKIYQELLLEDGDLHSDGSGRQRRFRWRDNGFEEDGEVQNSDGEDGDVQTELVVDASWQLQRLERQRWLQDQRSASQVTSTNTGVDFAQHWFPRLPSAARMQESRLRKKGGAEKPAVCGSFLKLGTSVLGRIAERIKIVAPAEKEGSVTTKNFVFRATDEKPVQFILYV